MSEPAPRPERLGGESRDLRDGAGQVVYLIVEESPEVQVLLVQWLGRAGAVRVLDDAAGLLEAGEEGVELGNVALDKPELTDLRQNDLGEAVRVGVGGGVGAALPDLDHPDVGRLAESRVRLQYLGPLAETPPKLLLEGLLRAGL